MVNMAKWKYFDARQLIIIVCFLRVFVFHVSCVSVNVTRKKQDIFTNPIVKNDEDCMNERLEIACKKRKAIRPGENGCVCQCDQDTSTFVEKNLSCIKNRILRNSSNQWSFLLSKENTNVNTPIGVLKLNSNLTDVINIKVNPILNARTCQPYRVEVYEKDGSWGWININLSSINMRFHTAVTQPKIISLTIQWENGTSIAGKIMRIKINCTWKAKRPRNDFVIFKVAGTFKVEIPVIPSESLISSTSSTVHPMEKTVSKTVSNTLPTSMLHSSPMVIISSTINSTIIQISSTINLSVNSKDSSKTKAAVIAGVIGGLLALVLVVLIIVYILRKKKEKLSVSENYSGRVGFGHGMFDKNIPLPTLSNPICEDVAYQRPENGESYKKRKSGVNIGNANYDQCLVVENPSARPEIPSVYDNICPEPNESQYSPLDPAKRLPSNKYQSLILPDNEYSAIAAGSAALTEPVYSVIDDKPLKNVNLTSDSQPKSEPVYNVLEANESSVQAACEPVYNVLEQSNEKESKGEPVYNVLEQSDEIQGK